MDLTAQTSLSPIRRGFMPSFVNYKKESTLLPAASDKVYQLLAHGRWFSQSTSASSITKTGRHDIAEILLKVALSTINQIKSHGLFFFYSRWLPLLKIEIYSIEHYCSIESQNELKFKLQLNDKEYM